jgi:hypothetical protein
MLSQPRFGMVSSLHEKAYEILSCKFQHDTETGMFDLAGELEDELSDVIE